jgi:flagellar hook-associated protein 2
MSINGSLSGISFTGLASGIDSQSIVSQLMQIEALPLQRMQQQQAILGNKQSLFAQLKSMLVAFNSSASALNTTASFNPITASSSNSEVATASATSSAVAGVFNLAVSKLATTHKTSSTAQSSASTALGYSGSFVVNGRAVTVESSDTLTSIAGKINSAGAGVTASVINGGSGSSYLTLTAGTSGGSNEVQLANLSGTALTSLGFLTGAASFRDPVDADSVRSLGFSSSSSTVSSLLGKTASGTFDIGTATISIDFSTDTLESIADKINAEGTANATAQVVTVTEGGKTLKKLEITGNGGVPPTITDTSGLLESIGVYQRAYTNELVGAQDAEYSLDGFDFTSASNTITDVVPGATFTLIKANETTPETATLTFTKDTAAIKTSFESLVSSYNDVVEFVKQTTEFDTETFASGPLFGESAVSQVESTLSNLLFRDIGTGTLKNFAQIGFGFDSDGKLTLDSAKLEQVLASDSEGVRRLMMAVGDSTSNDLKFISSTSLTQNSGVAGYQVDVTQVATKGNILATIAQTIANTAGETLTFSGGLFNNTDYVLNVPIGATLSDLVSQINNDTKLKDLVVASIDGGGALKLESKKWGTNGNFGVTSNLAAANDNSGIGTTGGTVTDGLDVAGTINGLAATGSGQFLTGGAGTAIEGLQIQYLGSATGVVGTINFQRGVAAELSFSLNTFTDAVNGLLVTTDKTLQSQIDDIGDRITNMQERLKIRQAYLQQKFLAMERAVSSMQAQQAQLSAMVNKAG